MSIANATETNILRLIYLGTAWANVADNAAGTPLTNIAVALHTADPTDSGNMGTSEANYTPYARVNVARSAAGWAEANGVVTPVAAITFPAGSSGSGSATHWSTGKTGGGATEIFWSGTIVPSITLGAGVTPQLGTASAIGLD